MLITTRMGVPVFGVMHLSLVVRARCTFPSVQGAVRMILNHCARRRELIGLSSYNS